MSRLLLAVKDGAIGNVKKALEQDSDSANYYDASKCTTPLHEACYFGFQDIAELLLEAGADVNMAVGRVRQSRG